MSADLATLLWALSGILIFFGIVMFLGLRTRKSNMAKNLLIKAADVWPSIREENWNSTDFIYGIWQDASSLNMQMSVRDFQDRDLGIVTYYSAQTGCRVIETPSGNFEVDSLPTLKPTVILHAAGNDESVLSTVTRSKWWGPQHRVEIPGYGTLESGRAHHSWRGIKFVYTLNGNRVGLKTNLGKWVSQGRLLVMPAEIPIEIRIFILSM